MGIRSMNYIVLKPGVCLPDLVHQHLRQPAVSNRSGKLFIYESNFTPMWARDLHGAECTFDLEEEVAIQKFLGSIDQSDFYMSRAGAECGHRGNWKDHPFADIEEVRKIEAEYRKLCSD